MNLNTEADKAGTAGFNMYRVLHAIKMLKKRDFVIVMHGGNEYNPIPSPDCIALCTFVDLGAMLL